MKKKVEKKPEKSDNKPAKKEAQNENNEGFNFGGIPARDLKKNLGC